MIRGLFTAICALALTFTCSLLPADEPQPVGYLIRPTSDVNLDAAEEVAEIEQPATSFVTRNGQKTPVVEGMEVYQNDLISTEKAGSIAVVFLDSTAVTLRESSALRINDYSYPAKKSPTHVSLEAGKAFFSINPRPADAHFFVKTALGQVEVKGTKFEIFTHADGAGYKTTVAVTDGTVTVKPDGQGGVDLLAGALAVLSIASQNVVGFSGAQVDLTKGNVSKDQIKTMKAGAITDVIVSTGKKNDVKISSISKNPDGTITYIKLTEVNSVATKIQTSVKNAAGKIIIKISESAGKISASFVDGTLSIKQKLVGGTGTVQIKDNSNKASYKGTVTTLADGTEVSDGVAKDKSRLVITKQTLADGTIIKTRTTFAAGASEGSRVTEILTRDGGKTTYTEAVSNQLINGLFTAIGPKTGEGATPPRPEGPPAIVTAGDTVIVPDSSPVSP
ncbi:MAG TPA: FecR domain-containing protein [Planctomycetota bacterium]|nr:FecR domain-containing protein [Planctomycetota bacterium]